MKIIRMIYDWSLQFMPFLRIVWTSAIVLGIAMLIIAFVLKKNPAMKNAPYIVGGIGLLIVISSSTQLIASLYLS